MSETETQSSGSKARTFDGFDNFLTKIGIRNDNTLSASTYEFNLITRNRILLEAAYRGSWIVGAIVDCVAEDMTRSGIDVTTSESEKDLKDLFNCISRWQVWGSICALIKWGRLYGGAIAIVQIKGQALDTPLNTDTIAKDQFGGLVVYDRWQLNPILQDLIQSGPDMGLPQYYDIVTSLTSGEPDAPTSTGQIRVHHSRVIRYTGIDLPFFQAITEMMWGESNLERLWDRLISFDNATMSSAALIDRANLRTVQIEGLREVIAAGGPAYEGLLKFFETMKRMQVNEGLTLLDTKDTFTATAYSFAGLSDMMLQFGQQLSGACGIPLTRLFGQAPAGLGDTGDSVLRTYYDNINSQQNAKLRNGMDVLLKILWRSTYGEPAPHDLEFTFTPLWQMSGSDKATIAKTNTDTIVEAFESNLIDKETGMKELKGMSGDTGMFSSITDEDIADAKNEDPPEPDMPEEPKDMPPEKTGDSKLSKIKKWLSFQP